MQARAALLDELRDRRIGRGRLEQLEAGFADRHEVRANPLRRHLFRRFDLQPERVAIKRERGVEILHGDADMIENGFHIKDCSFHALRVFMIVNASGFREPSPVTAPPPYTDRVPRRDSIDDGRQFASASTSRSSAPRTPATPGSQQALLVARSLRRAVALPISLRLRSEPADRLDQFAARPGRSSPPSSQSAAATRPAPKVEATDSLRLPPRAGRCLRDPPC